ncbi:NYN domain-containing protein [Saccharopolyspora sp. HNM0983]|uniref:NYN domain-containing protein n=1 Tax=Saccharopolyspora montiporae TaxID=2781240 RepID=A0A929BDL3_9PSEU|nr:NYN domain-containing protein [Saccharopolyspora sp. HNM0983]MBE9376420.1 NYN domain-containing protein [Saccharopolyspora sp. HNM0983]
MRARCAVYTDAGYLLAAAATRRAGTSLRSAIEVDHRRVIDTLEEQATSTSGLPLLRVHWYDAARHGIPDQAQETIGLLPRVKVRLGRTGHDGEQKGVDLRLGLDLVAHARAAAVDAMFLVSGDDDLTEAVEEAQAHGVQVTVLAVPNRDGRPHGISRHLQAAADGLELLSADALDDAVAVRSAAVPSPEPTTSAPRPPVPSPALFARSAAAKTAERTHVLPNADDQPVDRTALVCSSSSGSGTTLGSDPGIDPEHDASIDRVVRRVLDTWLSGSTADRRAELAASRPSIPRDVDKALLLDLSDVLGIYDLSDAVRYELRARFWTAVDASAPD